MNRTTIPEIYITDLDYCGGVLVEAECGPIAMRQYITPEEVRCGVPDIVALTKRRLIVELAAHILKETA